MKTDGSHVSSAVKHSGLF